MAQTSTIGKVSKSALFTVYNKARACGLDRARVNRAMGIVQAGKVTLNGDGSALVDGDKGKTYTVRGKTCNCPDHTYRGVVCKHIVARWLVIRMSQVN